MFKFITAALLVLAVGCTKPTCKSLVEAEQADGWEIAGVQSFQSGSVVLLFKRNMNLQFMAFVVDSDDELPDNKEAPRVGKCTMPDGEVRTVYQDTIPLKPDPTETKAVP